jgi:hypothetical protein
MTLPEVNTSHHIITAIAKNAKIVGRDGKVLPEPFRGMSYNKWRKLTQTLVLYVHVLFFLLGE